MRSSPGADPLSNVHVHHAGCELDGNLVRKVGGARYLWVVHVEPAPDLEQEIIAVGCPSCGAVFSPALTPREPFSCNLPIDLTGHWPGCSLWVGKRSPNDPKGKEGAGNLKQIASDTGKGAGLVHRFEQLGVQRFQLRAVVAQQEIAEASNEIMMIFFLIAPPVEDSCELLDEEGIEIARCTEQIGKNGQLSTCGMLLACSIPSSIAPGKRAVA